MVIVNKIDAAMEVLVKKSTDFANRPHLPSCKYIFGWKEKL